MLKSSLQIKVATTFIAFMAIMAALLFVYQQLVLIPVYSALERAFVSRELERVAQVFRHEQIGLAALAADWSSWDDTYEYAINHNVDYEQGNLNLSSLANLSVNLLFIYDKSGDAVWGGAFEPGKETWTSIAAFPSTGRTQIPELLSFSDTSPDKQGRAGFVLTEKGPLLVASHPILNSHGKGEPHGVLVMGRLLTGENIEKLQQLAGLPFEVVPTAALPAKHKALALTQSDVTQNALHIEYQDPDTLVAWRTLLDLLGQPSVLLKVSIARDIFRTGYQGLRNGIWLMIASMLILMAVLMVLVHREIVRPIVRISRQLVQLRLKGNYDKLIDYNARNELGRLVRFLNELLMTVSEHSKQLKDISYEDSLTGVANRRCFNEKLQEQWLHCAHAQQPLAVILCDIDYFKLYNDHYGHLQGDVCLREVAQSIKRAANKKGDLVSRFGGEEFVILLPNTTLLDAISVAERICATVQALHIEHISSRTSEWVTISLGVAGLTPSPERAPELLLHAADNALYRAKAKGRNRVAAGAVESAFF